MSLPTNLSSVVLETILTGLATFFLAGAGGDPAAARHAASHMLAAYHPENEDELRLAANIVGFSFQGFDALAQAAAPDTPATQILRLRSIAIGLNRESGKAERRLNQLQKARKLAASAVAQPEAAQPEAVQPEPIQPEPMQAKPKIGATVAAAAKASGLTWTQAHQQRQRERRLAASLKRAEERFGMQAGPAIHDAPSHHPGEPVVA